MRKAGRRFRHFGTDQLGGLIEHHVAAFDLSRAIAQQQRPAHHVFQLADVARPAVDAQPGQRAFADPRHLRARGSVAQQHRHRQRCDILAPLAQRREGEGEHVEAIEQVGAEPALGDFGGQIAVDAGDHPDVDLDRLGCADRHDLALLQRAQQLGLERQRHLGDLVEQQRAPVGGAEEALAGLGRPGERAFLVAEQHRLEHRFGHRRAVDRHERTVAARAAIVDEAAQHFLAGSGRAVDQHRDVAVGEAFAQRQDRQAVRIGGDRGARRTQAGEQRGGRNLRGGIDISQRERALAGAAQRGCGAASQRDATTARFGICLARLVHRHRLRQADRPRRRGDAVQQRRVACPGHPADLQTVHS